MNSQIIPTLFFFAVCALVVFFGWEEPLRYRFLSPQQITEIENPGANAAPATAGPSQWRPQGTSLDRAPYETDNGGVTYSDNIDNRKMGVRTEQEQRKLLREGKGAR